MISVKGVSVDPQKIEKIVNECDRDTKFSRFSRVLSEGC